MNVGDYVRDHIYGIGRIIKCYDNELEIVFKKSRIKTSVSSYFEFNLNKSSPQIIDLIEYMDMLYLKKPIKIYGTNKTVKLFNPVRCDGFTAYDDGTHCIILDLDHIVDVNDLEIEAVITHEQMEAMQYRVEE